ncbi:gamma-glutamylcyclotransferase [Metabacillus arenae]|uniref:Gamma-glutamylcyclotransferase n=1 Tax=Metabacillus arenae TaxID=2771434 RepID=A0A926NBU3_9BACI|nr:gamma-glutamylcyclotransferase family protein [Metabacillus arenae]MBD1381367.1 gamma-glutamylcyclotransferase [Metabacillus arenae]
MNHLLFVYGTLRKYQNNHHYIEKSKLVAEQASISGVLVDTKEGYPALTLGKGTVYGEVYQVDKETLKRVDQLEEFKEEMHAHNLYQRKLVKVMTDSGELEALTYYMNEAEVKGLPIISSGDWKENQLIHRNQPFIYYFAFGSCMDVERFQLAKVDHHFTKVIGAGKLKNYSTRFTINHIDGGRADLVEDGGRTEGILYQIPYEAVLYLYEREGVDIGHYRPSFVDIEVDGTLVKDCLTFLVKEKEEESAPPDHYFTEILRGAKGRLSDDYMNLLEKHVERLLGNKG